MSIDGPVLVAPGCTCTPTISAVLEDPDELGWWIDVTHEDTCVMALRAAAPDN